MVRTRRTLNKVEAIGSDLYYILAMCVEVDGFPYSLECVNPIYSDDVLSDENENLLNQLLMRNRQVYTDSLTKVFNRRYCDDRLRRLSGEYALAMIDIDNLKQINDRFGHRPGIPPYITLPRPSGPSCAARMNWYATAGMSSCCCSTVCRRISCGAS